MAKVIREKIIQQLASGDFVSGEKLGNDLGVSRAAIAKHIEAIAEMGLDIFRVTGKGYKLAKPLSLLSKEKISNLLESNDEQLEIHRLIDSTNSYLLRRLPHQLQNGQVCLAEFQSAGRGRRGRQWISPFGSHIYMSMYRYLEQGMSGAMGLSVVAALAVFDSIKALYHIDVELKWPNDVYLNGKKLAGILIDLEGQPLEACHCIIGIGLNLNMPDESAQLVDQPWSELSSMVTQPIDRNALAASLINHLNKRLIEHKESGLSNMLSQWHQHDIYFNKPIKIITGIKETFGISRGIDNQGALLIESAGKISPVYGGEVSLRGLT
jgi:BirA family biotin operon repressor/biotin-[acetyl-CoA-carboxylase] ligase